MLAVVQHKKEKLLLVLVILKAVCSLFNWGKCSGVLAPAHLAVSGESERAAAC